MRKIERLWAFIFAAILVLVCFEASAGSGKDIIVFTIAGKGGANVRDKLVKALSKQGYNIASRKEAKEIALGMGHKSTPTDPAERLKIAQSLNLDAFLSGKVKVKGKNRMLSLQIFVICENGVMRTLEYDWVGKIPSDTVDLIIEQLDNEIQTAIKECWAEPEPVPVEPVAPPVEPEKKKKKLGIPKSEGGKYCKHGGMRCGLPPAVVFNLGFLVSSRRLEVPADTLKYKYEGSAYPLFGLNFGINIGRFFKKNPRFCVGILFDFAHSFALVSNPLDPSDPSGHDLETKDVRLKAGASLEIAPKPDSLPLWILFDIGWGMHNFLVEFDPTNNPYISDYNYKFVDIGLGLRADIIRRWLDVQFRMGFLIPYTLGDAEKFYGSKAEGRFGFNAGLRLGGVIAYGLHWGLGFDFIGYTAKYKGTGTISPAHPSGEKTKDFYPTGYFMVGYRF